MDAPRYPVWPMPDSPHEEERLWLGWLVRLRWVAVLAQVLTVSLVLRVLDGPEVVLAALAVAAVLVAVNLWSLRTLYSDRPVSQATLLSQLGLDVLALTAFLFLAGGPTNPFTNLYLVHIAMGAVMLQPRWAAFLTVLVLSCYGALYLGHLPVHLDRHSLGTQTLMSLGDVLSLAIAALSVTGFVIGIANTLRWRSKLLLEARDRSARHDRLRSVGTLAAGAAHELNTPLSTMGLRIRRLARRHQDADTEADLAVIRGQLDRCEEIVHQLLISAGDPATSLLERRSLGKLVSETVARWSEGHSTEVRLRDLSEAFEVEVPRVAFTHALVNLLDNAREAQLEVDSHDAIEVDVLREKEGAEVVVRDHGIGLPPDADRMGDPFFTTKIEGTGLGVYVARAVADGTGGELRYVREQGRATAAHWWFPDADRRLA
ncbi:MAG: HAMP domain-containing histidine kinase [Deltaproteobacteria bacterium]|nr:HAMP domain-containing histidine kinase [Deltaproteobacteria bacterium]MBW2255073.1 HAMP domain-containing histidine kinase [Deltaproteobacteria bacterium]